VARNSKGERVFGDAQLTLDDLRYHNQPNSMMGQIIAYIDDLRCENQRLREVKRTLNRPCLICRETERLPTDHPVCDSCRDIITRMVWDQPLTDHCVLGPPFMEDK